jgi:putative colanic acid biosynthesis acetyltransferase WcaF
VSTVSTGVQSDPSRLRRMMWSGCGRWCLRFTPHVAYGLRNVVLRMFGASIERGARVRRSASIDAPWQLRLGARSMIGDKAMIAGRHPVTIGRGTTISQGVALLTAAVGVGEGPIRIGSGCWIAAETIVLPESLIGDGTVVGARSQVAGVLPADVVSVGLPAVAVGPRVR